VITFINSVSQYEACAAKNKELFLMFRASWWLQCKAMESVISELDKTLPEITFLVINLEAGSEDSEEFIRKFRVKHLPTFIYLRKPRTARKSRGAGAHSVCFSVSGTITKARLSGILQGSRDSGTILHL
jgi:thiol:disulfide interchange protein